MHRLTRLCCRPMRYQKDEGSVDEGSALSQQLSPKFLKALSLMTAYPRVITCIPCVLLLLSPLRQKGVTSEHNTQDCSRGWCRPREARKKLTYATSRDAASKLTNRQPSEATESQASPAPTGLNEVNSGCHRHLQIGSLYRTAA